MTAHTDPVAAGLPKTMSALRLGALFGLDRVEALRAFDGIMSRSAIVSVAEGIAALRQSGRDPEAIQISLSDPVAATTILVAAQVQKRLATKELIEQSGVSESSIRTWLRGDAAPTLRNFTAFASALGFDLFLVKTPGTGGPDDEISLSKQRAAMERLFAERTRIGAGIMDLEFRSGISTKAMYSWLSGKQAPGIGNLVALAETLGFEIVMRRKEEA